MKIKMTAANIITALGLFVIIYLTVSLIDTVRRNYELSKRIDNLTIANAIARDERDSLGYRIQYYKTDSFIEREARAKLGLQLPGENVVLLPRRVVEIEEPAMRPAPKKSNPRQWLDFLSGRL